MMMENGVTINVDQMAKMQEMSERFEADEARKAFHVAMAEFKKNPPKVLKNKTVTYGTGDNETSYKHVTLASLATILDESLSKCDLSFTWKTEDLDKGLIKVTCILTHKLGHSESASMSSLPDGSGKKNPIQAKGSAISYLQRYTLKAVAGVAEEGQDDDGAAAGSGDKPAIIGIPEKEQWECIDLIIAELPADPPIDREKLARWFLATTHKYPSTKTRVIAAAEHVMQQSPQNIYVDANDNEQPGEFGTE
jgi:hypothetical protein